MQNLLWKNVARKRLAQAASELAIFGTILLFLIGGIMRAGFQQTMGVNQNLRAMRMAMQESWKTAQGYYTLGERGIARNNCSVIIIEDRLSADPNQKFGSVDRIPFLAAGSGTFTQNLMYGLHEWKLGDLSVIDIFVNGQRFPLTTANFAYYDNRVQKYNDGTDFLYCDPKENPGQVGHPHDTRCKDKALGVTVFFRAVFNAQGSQYSISKPLRFDLDFDGTVDVNSEELRRNFGWQWKPVAGVWHKDADISGSAWLTTNGAELLYVNTDDHASMSFDIDGDFKDEVIYKVDLQPWVMTVPEPQTGQSRRTRQTYPLPLYQAASGMAYLDFNNGDYDTLYESPTGDPMDYLGLQPDANMYSVSFDRATLGEGTYYRVEQGKLYSVDGIFIRNITRQDRVDLITRKIRLNRNTGRFCPLKDGTELWDGKTPIAPVPWSGPGSECKKLGVCTLTNPVERCGACFTADGIDKTCMEKAKGRWFIHVRSRMQNIGGTKWITKVDN